MAKVRLGITAGDPGGIGPEIIAKLLKGSAIYKECFPVIFGSSHILKNYLVRLPRSNKIRFIKYGARYSLISPYGKAILIPGSTELSGKIKVGKISKANGIFSYRSIEESTRAVLRADIDGLVTGPVSKEAIALAAPEFRGHTEFFKKRCRASDVVMFFWSPRLKVALLTRHITLADVTGAVKKSKIAKMLKIINSECVLLGMKNPRIAVCGLNPHAGEGGLIGQEDKNIVLPAVKRAVAMGISAFGPVPSDTAFWQALKGKYDIIFALYHDQGLAPFKMFAFQDGVQLTMGLPFVRTSPDHGCAFDIAGKNTACTGSFMEAIRLAAKMVKKKRQVTRDKRHT